MIQAVQADDVGEVRRLVEDEEEVRAKDKFGLTALHWAAINHSTDLIEILLRHRIDVNVRDKEKMTPLHHACESPDIVGMLLAANADVNAQDERGETVLHLAAKAGNIDVVRLLLEHRADPNIKDWRSATPLTMAISELLLDISLLLIEYGANVNMVDDDLWTPLHHVASSSDEMLPLVPIICAKGVKINAVDELGNTAIDYAEEHANVAIQEELERQKFKQESLVVIAFADEAAYVHPSSSLHREFFHSWMSDLNLLATVFEFL